MLYLAIPAHNEAATIGVLLWRLRTVLAEFPREYEAVVYDDASSDSTSEILESYARVMPLTVLRGDTPVGYPGALDVLVRHIARQTRYPRRDAMLVLQGDFTDPPAMVPEFVKRFEGGADLVIGERAVSSLKDAPLAVRRMQRATSWLLRLLVKAQGVRDVTSSFRLMRISVLRDLLRNVGDGPICVGDSRSANADLLLRLIPLARRVETLEVEPTWGVRIRETRLIAMRDGMALARWAWRARGRKAVASTAPDTGADTQRQARPTRDRDGSNVLPFEPVETSRSTLARTAPGSVATTLPARRARPARPATTEVTATPAASAIEPDEEGAVTPLSSARTRPPRRKRSRGGRKESSGNTESGSGEEGRPIDPDSSASVSAEAALPIASNSPRDSDTNSKALTDERPMLSPTLSEAAEAAEDSFDAEATSTRPPRKRRRRRGARKGSRSSETDGESTAEEGGATSSNAAASESETDSPYAEENISNALDGEPDGDASEADETAAGETRARRRGRRGRRGGSRRNRSAREDGSAEPSGGEAGRENVSDPPASTDGAGAS